MLDYSELIERLERLPVHEGSYSAAKAQLFATQPNVYGFTRAFTWLKDFSEKCGRQRAVSALKLNSLLTA